MVWIETVAPNIVKVFLRNDEGNETPEDIIRKIREVSTMVEHSMENCILRLDLSGSFVCPQDQVKRCICEMLEKCPCRALFLRSFEDPMIDLSIKEMILKAASGQCSELILDGQFSEDAILAVHDFLEKNGGVKVLEFSSIEMSDMARALLSST